MLRAYVAGCIGLITVFALMLLVVLVLLVVSVLTGNYEGHHCWMHGRVRAC